MRSLFRAFALAVVVAAVTWSIFSYNALSAEKKGSRDYTIIKIGNDEIKHSEVMDVWEGLFPSGSAPDFDSFDESIRQNVLRGMVSERLIYQEAMKAGYDKNSEVKKRMEALEKQVIMQTFMEAKAKSLVDDAALKAAYSEKATAMKGEEEVKARHILVASEEEAKKLAEQLKKGGDFNKLAKDKSTDKASGANGGDLGWFTKDRMVPEFADAAFKMKKGELSAPVKTAFGWHIIKVEDRRPVKIPGFDDMKEALQSEVTNQAVQAYVEGLLKGTTVKYYSPDGKEKELALTLKPAPGSESPAAGEAEQE